MNRLQKTYKTFWNLILLTLGMGVISWLLYVNMLIMDNPDMKSFIFFMTVLVMLALIQYWFLAGIIILKNGWFFMKNPNELVKNHIEILEYKAKKKDAQAEKLRHKAMKLKFKNLDKGNKK